MSNEQEPKKPEDITDVVFDNIKEQDNNLPKWWLWLFYITIAWGIFYVAYYQFGPGLQPHERLALEMKEHEKVMETVKEAEKVAEATAEKVDYLALAKSETNVAHGREVFVAKCVACHADKGEGLVGPNLTDEYWIHGGSLDNIVHVVENGVIEKGMLAWKGVLKKDELEDVIAYVWSIKNTNVAGKAPEGEKE